MSEGQSQMKEFKIDVILETLKKVILNEDGTDFIKTPTKDNFTDLFSKVGNYTKFTTDFKDTLDLFEYNDENINSDTEKTANDAIASAFNTLKIIYNVLKMLQKEVTLYNEETLKELIDKSKARSKTSQLNTSQLPQPNFDTPNTDIIEKQVKRILNGDETIPQKSYEPGKLAELEKYSFKKKDSKEIKDFIEKCIINNESKGKKVCQELVPNIIYDSDHLNYFEEQIKTLSKNELIRIAFNLDVRRYTNGMFETGNYWAQHIIFINTIEGEEKGILEDRVIKFAREKKSSTYGTDDAVSKLWKNKKTIDAIKSDEEVYNYIQKLKRSYIDFVNVLSFTINEKIREEKSNNSIYRNDKGEPFNSTFNSGVVQYRVPNPLITFPLYPFSFLGGKFEFKPNNNQSADILEKMINSLISNLNSHNKYLDPKDMAVIKDAIKKMRNLEKYLAELFVTGSNYAQYIQQEKDYSQKQIKLQEINNINKKINDTSNKMITLKQKLEYIINHMYLLQKDEAEKQSTPEQKQLQAIGINFTPPPKQKEKKQSQSGDGNS